MATGSSITDSNDTLTCPVCLDTFQDPRVLPCEHSLCGPNSNEKCIIKLETQDGTITCPRCGNTHNMQATDAAVSFTLANLVAEMKSKRMCEKHSEEILYYCEADEEEFCMTCWQVDHMGENHKVAPISTRVDTKLLTKWRKLDSQLLESSSRERTEQITKIQGTLKRLAERETDYRGLLLEVMEEGRGNKKLCVTRLETFFDLEDRKAQDDESDWQIISYQVGTQITPVASGSSDSELVENNNQVHVSSGYHQVKVPVPTWKSMEIKSSTKILTGTKPIFSPTENSFYIITMPYSFERYSYIPENISLEFEEIHQWKKPISCIALGPESSIYISFDSERADVCQYFRQTGQISTIDISKVSGKIKSLTSFPNKFILLLETDKKWFVFKNNKFIKALIMVPKGFFVTTDDGTDNGLFVETIKNHGNSMVTSVNVHRFNFKELEKPMGASYIDDYLPLKTMIRLSKQIESCLISSILANDKGRLVVFMHPYYAPLNNYINRFYNYDGLVYETSNFSPDAVHVGNFSARLDSFDDFSLSELVSIQSNIACLVRSDNLHLAAFSSIPLLPTPVLKFNFPFN